MPSMRFTGTSAYTWSASLPVAEAFISTEDTEASHNFRGVCACAGCMGKAEPGDVAANTIPGDSSSTEVLTLGTARTSAIDFVGDTDWFRVTLTAGQTYNFSLNATNGSTLDPLLNLRDSGGAIVASNDDANPPALDSAINGFVATTSGTYFVEARAFNTETGGYTLLASQVSNANDTILGSTGTTSTITIGGAAQQSAIDFAGDSDWFRVTLTAGQSYAFALSASGGSPLGDPYLELRDANGTLISIDDDGAPAAGVDSLMRFTATSSGTYYISARAFENETGAYTLTADTGPAQNPLDTIDLGFTVSQQNISVYFAVTTDTIQGESPVRNWTVAERASAMAALQTFANVTNLTFTETGTLAGARFVLSLSTLDANVLGQFGTSGGIGYGQFSPTASGWTTAGLTPGGLGFVTLVHEFGHGLGLTHPHEDGQDIQIMQGVIDSFGSYGTFLLNQGVFTTMTYNDGWPGGPTGSAPSNNYGSQMSPMALDIALMQLRYGANVSFNTGDNTYVLPDTNGGGTGYFGIWDAGGTDTISYSGTRNTTIDLRPATILSEIGGGGFVSFASGVFGGVTIARNVVIENATGGSGNDTLTGNTSANRLDGGAGADTLNGGAGNDTYLVDNLGDVILDTDGDDLVESAVTFTLAVGMERLTLTGASAISGTGNEAANTLRGNGADNALHGNGGADSLYGEGGGDTISGGLGADTAYGGAAGDIVYGDDGDDVLIGEGGTDQIYGGAGADSIDAGSENDTVYAGLGNDLAQGGLGADVLIGEGGNDQLYGGDDDDSIDGGTEDDIVYAGAGADFVRGSDGSDILIGEGGNDQLYGDGGNDGADGGAGNDTFYGGDGNDYAFGLADADVLVGQDGLDSLYGGAGADGLDGGLGVDLLAGEAGDDLIYGGDGADAIDGGDDNDIVYSDGDNDYARGGLGNDVIVSGVGADRIDGDAGDDSMDGGLDNDTIYGGDGADFGRGGDGADLLIGQAGNDRLDGEDGNDAIDAGIDNDTVYAGAGNDYVSGDDGADVIIGGIGNDSLYGGTGADAIDAGDDDDFVYAGSENDYVAGGAGVDSLYGEGGLDTIYGGLGNDYIVGGAGNDTLYGEGGADLFAFAAGSGADVISGFEDGSDRIDLRTYAGATIGNTTIAQIGADTRITLTGGETILLIGITATNITAGDFLFT